MSVSNVTAIIQAITDCNNNPANQACRPSEQDFRLWNLQLLCEVAQAGGGGASGPQLFSACLCDDVNGDGSVVVNFIRVVSITDGGVLAQVGDFLPDYSATYTPLGTVTPCGEVGAAPAIAQVRELLVGPTTWVRPANLQSLTYKYITDGGTGGATVTDNNTTVTPLVVGDIETFSTDPEFAVSLGGTFQLDLLAGDQIVILYTEII